MIFDFEAHRQCLELASHTRIPLLAAGSAIEAEDAEIAGGFADFLQGLLQFFQVLGFDVDEELIFEGLAVDGAALDLQQIHTVIGKRFERSQQGSGLVSQTHGQRHFARVRSAIFFCFGRGQKQHESREILGIVLNAFAKNDCTVMTRGT